LSQLNGMSIIRMLKSTLRQYTEGLFVVIHPASPKHLQEIAIIIQKLNIAITSTLAVWNWSWWSMFTELVFNEVRVDRTLVFCVVFCRSLFVLLSISIWPLYFLPFFFVLPSDDCFGICKFYQGHYEELVQLQSFQSSMKSSSVAHGCSRCDSFHSSHIVQFIWKAVVSDLFRYWCVFSSFYNNIASLKLSCKTKCRHWHGILDIFITDI
jgi:hypothetical protein